MVAKMKTTSGINVIDFPKHILQTYSISSKIKFARQAIDKKDYATLKYLLDSQADLLNTQNALLDGVKKRMDKDDKNIKTAEAEIRNIQDKLKVLSSSSIYELKKLTEQMDFLQNKLKVHKKEISSAGDELTKIGSATSQINSDTLSLSYSALDDAWNYLMLRQCK